MKINNNLILQWEPKIQKLLSGVFIVGMERDDIAQELRIAIIRAAEGYDSSRGVLFHTYLHTTLVNTIRTLMSKAHRQPTTKSLDFVREDSETVSLEIEKALTDPTDYSDKVDTDNWIDSQNLQDIERLFIQLKLEGLTMDEITADLKACRVCVFCEGYTNGEIKYMVGDIEYVAYNPVFSKGQQIVGNYANCLNKNGESAYKVREQLREKFADLAYEYGFNKQV
jgi:DNA-directed RNA polymerase specialized sigma24 family protein